MNIITEKDRLDKYNNLMKWKKYRNRTPFLVLFICFIFSFIIQSDRVVLILFTVVGLSISFASHLILLAKNNCPWCNQPFFFHLVEDNESIVNKIKKTPFFLQKQCINCGRPFDKKLENVNDM